MAKKFSELRAKMSPEAQARAAARAAAMMNIEVGSYEAKTKLPELLRGEAVADLVPAPGNKLSDAAAAVDERRA